MAYPPQARQKARGLYVNGGLPLERVSAETGVPMGTLRSWKRQGEEKGDDWDRARNASRIAQGGMGEVTQTVMQDFVLFAQSIIPDINQSEISPQEKVDLIASFADSWSKFLRVMGKASPEIAKLSVAMEVQEAFVSHLRDRHRALLSPEMLNAINEFGPILSARFGAAKVAS